MISFIVFLFGSNQKLQAFEPEYYKGSEFPPNEVIEKNIKRKVIGKIRMDNGAFNVFFMDATDIPEATQLIPLDTGIWIYGSPLKYKILKK
jgi:hypothetical protein